MRSTAAFKICIFLMTLIALVEFRIPQFHPVTSLDRALSAISDQTDLAHVLHAAERAARGER